MHGVTSLGPSVIPSYLTGRPSEAITPLQIAALMDQYKAAVRRAREAGYDGIELHAAHGYMMLGSFLAPQRNRRTDDYRGDRVHGRLRIVLEALAAIRSEVGEDFPITLRISGFERVAGGRPMYETAQVAPQLVAAGVNAFHVSGGVIDRLVSKMVNGSDDGDGLNVGAAAAVREAVDVPVIAVGRLHDPDLAESVLEAGKADFVAMGRPLLADPELPNKLRTGGSVRQCISCENCIDALEIRFSVDCAVNPQTGREQDLTLRPTRSAQHVVVIGAGPGGMEAARSAAAIGHRVTLLEANRQLGGALLWASIVHPENQPFLDYLRSEIAAGPVEVRLGVRAGVEEVAALAPDAVIVATGGRVAVPAVEGDNLPHVLNGPALRELLAGRSTSDQPWSHRLGARLVAGRGQRLVTPAAVRLATKAWMPVGQRVVIIGADLVALEFAEFLAARGRRVTLLESGKDIAPEIGPKRKAEHMLRLDGLGVTVHVRAEVTRIVASGVEFVPAGGAARTLVADSVILAGTPESELTLYDALRERLPAVPVHAIGDSTGLGLIQKATADAARVVAGLNDA
jgi:2,4-dienoyl-CoA reductase (NADPH2)